jgi:hypothetical protein
LGGLRARPHRDAFHGQTAIVEELHARHVRTARAGDVPAARRGLAILELAHGQHRAGSPQAQAAMLRPAMTAVIPEPGRSNPQVSKPNFSRGARCANVGRRQSNLGVYYRTIQYNGGGDPALLESRQAAILQPPGRPRRADRRRAQVIDGQVSHGARSSPGSPKRSDAVQPSTAATSWLNAAARWLIACLASGSISPKVWV